MGISKYEIILPLIGEDETEIRSHALLVNGLYGAIDVVTKEVADKLNSGRFEDLPDGLRERLEKRGHLTQKSPEEEIADLRLLSHVYKETLGRSNVNLIIMPTYDCNFRCPYCYEQHRLKNGKEWLETTMSRGMTEAVFGAMQNYQKRGYRLSECTLYGGEPFLVKNIETVERIMQYCKDLNIPVSAISNGYDLDCYLDLLSGFETHTIQLSIDGAGKTNDRRRIHKDGLPTYDHILQNAEMALARGINITLRVNVGPENLHAIGELVADLKARGFIDKEEKRRVEEKAMKNAGSGCQKTKRGKFDYYFKATDVNRQAKNRIREKDILDELLKAGFTVKEAMGFHSQFNLMATRLHGILENKKYRGYSPAFCGAEEGMLVIDPFGQVHACWTAVGKKDEGLVGFVDEQSKRIFFNFNKARWRSRTVDLMERCRLCPYAFICRGGCAAHALHLNGSYFSEYCGEFREMFDFTASRVIGAHWNKTHEEELSLTLKEPLSRLTEAQRETILNTGSRKEMLAVLKTTGLFNNPEDKGNGTTRP